MTGIAAIDGDLLAYRAAAANEKRYVVAVHNETLEEERFDTATKFKEWAAGNEFEVSDYTVTPGQEPNDLSHALRTIKTMIANIMRDAKCDSYHIVVSGKGNFRDALPLPSKYKGTRDGVARPTQLAECREYLINHHNAEVARGEADDLLVGYAYQGYKSGERVVQCSIDKDAKHGPGWLYDWTTMSEPELIEGYGGLTCTLKETARKTAKGLPVVEKIIKGKGRAFLYFQMIFGDAVDAYKPCEIAKVKFGEVGAYELLKNATTDKEALEALVRQYKIWYKEPVTYQAWDGEMHTKDWLEIFQMYADCAWMRRWDGDRFDVKKVLDNLKIEY